MELEHSEMIVTLSWIIAFFLVLVGLMNYLKQSKKIAVSRKQIGGYKFDDEQDL